MKGVTPLLTIAVYSDYPENISALKLLIQDFLIEKGAMAKISCFSNFDDIIITSNKYDAYFLDMDSNNNVIGFAKQLKTIDTNGHFIFVSENLNNALLASKIRSSYFVTKPYEKEDIIEILTEIKNEIKEDSIIIKIPNGERRIRINNLNYINIVRRCLCYHLKDGTMFDGQTLRSSFEKAIDPLQKHKAFIFLAPSLLINLGEIKIINKDHIVFENDDILYFPMKQYDTLRNKWVEYNTFE